MREGRHPRSFIRARFHRRPERADAHAKRRIGGPFSTGWIAILTAFAFVAHPAHAFEKYKSYDDLRIRIAVVQEAAHIALGGTEDYAITGSPGSAMGTLLARHIYYADLTGDGWVVIRDSAGKVIAKDLSRIKLRPAPKSNAALYIQQIRDPGSWHSSSLPKAPSYRGAFCIGIARDGKLAAVNELPLEHYLFGVVTAEMGNFAPAEALKAQAVAARSEAYAKMKQGMTSDDPLFDFTDKWPQIYRGWRDENDVVRRAVDATRGEILTWHGQPVDAVYGDSCGGVTAEASEIWGGPPLSYSRREWDRRSDADEPDLRTFEAAHRITTTDGIDAFCNPNQDGFPHYAVKNFRWRRSYTAKELTEFIDPSYRTDRVTHLEVLRRSRSGRVLELRIDGERRSVVISKELHIRGALGSLKSIFFTFTVDEDDQGRLGRIHIYGAGNGHGVGMCQMGAFMMAKRNYAYPQILAHYYSGVSIERLYP